MGLSPNPTGLDQGKMFLSHEYLQLLVYVCAHTRNFQKIELIVLTVYPAVSWFVFIFFKTLNDILVLSEILRRRELYGFSLLLDIFVYSSIL